MGRELAREQRILRAFHREMRAYIMRDDATVDGVDFIYGKYHMDNGTLIHQQHDPRGAGERGNGHGADAAHQEAQG